MTDVLTRDARTATLRENVNAVQGVLRSSDSGVRPVFNLVDLGAKPTSARAALTTAAMERLITTELDAGEGCELWIPPTPNTGFYMDPWEDSGRMVTIRGFGREVSKLLSAGATTDPLLTFGDGATHQVGSGISDVSIDCLRRTLGSGHTGPAVKVNGRWDVIIERVKVFDTGGDGILVTGTVGNTQLYGSAHLSHCHIAATRGNNVYFDTYVVHSTVTDPYFAGAGKDNAGLAVSAAVASIKARSFSELTITGGTLDSSAGHGLWFLSCSQLSAQGVKVLGPDRHGVFCGGGGASGFGHDINVIIELAGHDGLGTADAFRVEDYSCRFSGTVRAVTAARVAYWVQESTGIGAASTPDYNKYDIVAARGGSNLTPGTGSSLLVGGNSTVAACVGF